MLKLGAKTNHKDNLGQTEIFYASREGKIEVVKLLIEYGGDIRIQDKKKMTAYSWAKRGGHKDLLDYLDTIGGGKNKPKITEKKIPIKKDKKIKGDKRKYELCKVDEVGGNIIPLTEEEI